MNLQALMKEIERITPDGGDWCDVEKSTALASIIVALRPSLVVEIGVFQGGSLVPMLLAMKHVGRGRAIAIDPWAPDASVIDQDGDNATWWAQVDHSAVYRKFVARMEVLGLSHLCTICHRTSDNCEPPGEIDMLHVDGNHGPQAVRDVRRFAANVTPGGILILDDLRWKGGHVEDAHRLAKTFGFRDVYPLGTGVVMQRRAGLST